MQMSTSVTTDRVRVANYYCEILTQNALTTTPSSSKILQFVLMALLSSPLQHIDISNRAAFWKEESKKHLTLKSKDHKRKNKGIVDQNMLASNCFIANYVCQS